MENHKNRAIVGSIQKWKDLISGKGPISVALNNCSLCIYSYKLFDDLKIAFWQNKCLVCPLYLANNGCMVAGSTWNRIATVLDPYKETDLYLADIEKDNPGIRELFQEMLNSLEDLPLD